MLPAIFGATAVPRASLSDLSIRAVTPPLAGSLTLWDTGLRNFGVRVTANGAKSFVILLGSGRRQTIGRFPVISLAQARSKARQIFAERTLGKYQPPTISWQAARDAYVSEAQRRLRPSTSKEYTRILSAYFSFDRLSEITAEDIARSLDRIRSTSQRDHALVAIKVFFRWALSRGHIQADPTTLLRRHAAPSRSRTLSDQELAAVWNAAEAMGQYGTIVRLLILTAQRRGEIAGLESTFIENGICTLPPTLTKNKRPHSFHICAQAAKILAATPSGTTALLFPARGTKDKTITGWSKHKAALDRRLGGTVAPFTLHDLRRTAATRMAELGVMPHIIERLLNHVSGEISGVAALQRRYVLARR